MDDSVGVETSVSEIVGSSSESMSEMGGIGEGPGMDRSVGDSSENSIIEGVGMKDSSISGDEGVSSKDGSVGDVGVSVVGDGARSVGVCSEGSLGLYDEGGRGTSSGPKSISKSISRWIGEGADEGAGGHRSDDGALGVGPGVPEGRLVRVIGEDAGHGRDVQTEESTTDTCERPHNVLLSRISSRFLDILSRHLRDLTR